MSKVPRRANILMEALGRSLQPDKAYESRCNSLDSFLFAGGQPCGVRRGIMGIGADL